MPITHRNTSNIRKIVPSKKKGSKRPSVKILKKVKSEEIAKSANTPKLAKVAKVAPRDLEITAGGLSALLNVYVDQYAKEVLENEAKLIRYIKSGHCRKDDHQKKILLQDFEKSDARFLSSNNPHARIHFARHWVKHGAKFTAGRQCYLVTLTPQRAVKALAAAGSFDLKSFMALVRQALLGLDYIGIVEPACYTNFQIGLLDPPAIAFHVHVIVRLGDKYLLRDLIDQFNAKHDAFIPGCPAADARPITPGDELKILKYLKKEPLKNYRAYPKKKEIIDPETGEIEKVSTGRFRQKDKPANPGLQLKVREVMKKRHLDKLMIAGGEGRPVIEALRKELLAHIPAKMRSSRQLNFSGHFRTPSWDDDDFE